MFAKLEGKVIPKPRETQRTQGNRARERGTSMTEEFCEQCCLAAGLPPADGAESGVGNERLAALLAELFGH